MAVFADIMIWPIMVFALVGFMFGLTTQKKVSALERRVKALESSNEK
ncbi:MAG: hypothetical protein ACYTDW_05800 [Planctomycetota bacterium]|jgi:hypothetical protein